MAADGPMGIWQIDAVSGLHRAKGTSTERLTGCRGGLLAAPTAARWRPSSIDCLLLGCGVMIGSGALLVASFFYSRR